MFRWSFLFLMCVLLSVSGHYRKVCPVLHSFTQIFPQISDIPPSLLFCRMKGPSSHLFLVWKVPQPFNHLGGPNLNDSYYYCRLLKTWQHFVKGLNSTLILEAKTVYLMLISYAGSSNHNHKTYHLSTALEISVLRICTGKCTVSTKFTARSCKTFSYLLLSILTCWQWQFASSARRALYRVTSDTCASLRERLCIQRLSHMPSCQKSEKVNQCKHTAYSSQKYSLLQKCFPVSITLITLKH